MREIKRGEIYYANLCPVMGSEQGGIHLHIKHIENQIKNS